MWKATAYSVVLLLLAFLGFYAAAAWSYPGGTWEEPHRSGHSFLFNYYCDLMRPVALNGQPNPLGSTLAEWGQLVFALSLGPFFWVAPRAFVGRTHLGRWVRWLGLAAAVAGVGVVLMPSWRFGQTVHGLMLFTCAVPALSALVSVMVGTWPVPHLRALAMALTGALLLTLAIFARQISVGAESTWGLAPLQRLDFALSLSWMVLTVRRAT